MAQCKDCIHFDVCYLSEIDNDIRDNGENPNCLHYKPTADVAPKSEVAREIFEEIEKIIDSHEITIGLIYDEGYGATVAIGRIDKKIAELKKEYTAGATEPEILYGGPREGGKRFAERRELLHRLKHEIHDKAVYPHNAGIDAYITLKAFDAILQNYLNGLK